MADYVIGNTWKLKMIFRNVSVMFVESCCDAASGLSNVEGRTSQTIYLIEGNIVLKIQNGGKIKMENFSSNLSWWDCINIDSQ
jgi:hypothetical protein